MERAAVSGDTLIKLLRDVVQAEPVAEAFVVSTCNRVEVYADVERFHAGVTAINNLNFEVEKGEIVGFLGPNGADVLRTFDRRFNRLLSAAQQPDARSLAVRL